MADVHAVLAALNFVVAALNAKTWRHSQQQRDFWAAVSWIGSGAYWLYRAVT